MSLPVLSDSLQSYFAEINRYPLLSAEDEFKVAERYHKARSLDDAHILVTSNLRYVVKIALEYRDYGCRLADLIQEGNIGLMTAVKKFNPFKGFRLITYATWWIRSFMQEFILRTRGMVKRGAKALKRKLFYRTGPLGTGEGEVDVTSDLSLDAALTAEQDGATHLDMLADLSPSQEEKVATTETTAIVKREINGALARLSEKERFVIENRLMSEEPESLQVIGDRLGLSRERVRQIENEALKKLHRSLDKSAAKEALG